MPSQSLEPLELWAGVECTVNRVGDRYVDQLRLSGHADRPEDLDLLAELGARAVRYPVLWERTAAKGLKAVDWSWADERLNRLRALGLRPIVGLVHHGSGPRWTSLVDPGFPEHLAAYARAAALRYPWIRDWTPVNEPLTTARFSGLYGHWFPHGRDDRTFARCLLTQCRAVVLAMRAIRESIPCARLVQTEDVGKTWSTPRLADQAAFENERRWVSFDLLSGRLDPSTPMWRWLRARGILEAELAWFQENACAPDLVGVNHYLSSERFLDERLDRYPAESWGGNGRADYADVLAARVLDEGPGGPADILREAWARYRKPLAVTEVHNGCTREEQLRWLLEFWRSAELVRSEGADVRAVTVWSVLGAYGWERLVTGKDGYESGVYDLRGGRPRPTALVGLARALAEGRAYTHPAAAGPGWWRRRDRLWYPPVATGARPVRPAARAVGKPVLVAGRTGTLGAAIARACEARGIPCRLLSRQELNVTLRGSVAAALDAIAPWAVVNAAGFVRVDDAEQERDACRTANVHGAVHLAEACAHRDVPYVTFSSDLVFDGAKRTPYVESDATRPLNVYGESKRDAERRVAGAWPRALVVRTSAFLAPHNTHDFVVGALRSLAAGDSFRAADDLVVSPTYVPDLADAVLDLLIDGETGMWHLANEGATTWAALAADAARLAGVETSGLVPVPNGELGLAAARPAYSVLGSERALLLPPLDDALDRYAAEWRLRMRRACA